MRIIKITDEIFQIFRVYTVISWFGLLIPKNRDLWIWTSHPILSDSPYIFYEYCRERYPNKRMIWIQKRGKLIVGRSDIEIYKSRSVKGIWYLLRAKVIFTNNNEFFRTKSPNQILIDFWHGIPIKSIMNFDKQLRGNMKNFAYRTDYRISSSRFVTLILSSAFGNSPKEYIEAGSPRLDRLLKLNRNGEVRRILNFDSSTRYVLWMPTYRKGYRNKSDGGGNPLGGINVKELQECVKKLGYKLLIKPHPFEESSFAEDDCVINSKTLQTLRLTNSDLLSVCDLLITDYSSVVIDFLSTSKPFLIYRPDDIEYAENRGYTFDPSVYLSSLIVKTNKELMDRLNNLDSLSVNSSNIKFLRDLYFEKIDTNNNKRVLEKLKQYEPKWF